MLFLAKFVRLFGFELILYKHCSDVSLRLAKRTEFGYFIAKDFSLCTMDGKVMFCNDRWTPLCL